MGRKVCARSTLIPCALCYSILKILCQLFQTAPDAVTDTAWVYALRCGNLAHTHTQVIPGRDIFSSKPYYFITEYFLLSFFLMVMRHFSLKLCLMNHPTSLHVLFELFLMLSEFAPLHKEVLNSMITVPFGLYMFHFLLLLS